jgi:hypothetical protein
MAYSDGLLAGDSFSAAITNRFVATGSILVSPNTDLCSGFEMEFFENVLHVFLDGARAAAKDLADLPVAFAGGDPFDDFELAFGERTRRLGVSGRRLVDLRCRAVPGGHGKVLLADDRSFVHTHNGVCRVRGGHPGIRLAFRGRFSLQD